jgi:hypothetical protein
MKKLSIPITIQICELSVAQLVGLFVVEPAHLGSSPRLDTGFISGFNSAILSVVGDVPVDSEASVVISSISRLAGPTHFFEGAYKGRVCVRAFVGVSVRSCI